MDFEIGSYKGRLQEQLEKARGSLNNVDSSLKRYISINPGGNLRITSRRTEKFDQIAVRWTHDNDNGFNDLRNSLHRRRSAKNFEKADAENIPIKRRLLHDATPKVLQCSLSGPPVVADYESEEDELLKKPAVSSYVVAKPIIVPSRQEAVSAKTNTETRARDRRMFGSLLGTLKKFRQEECQLKDKVEKKAQIEKKVEEAEKQEKERIKEDKIKLIRARKDREAYIESVERHLRRVKDVEEWEALQKPYFNYIKTKTDPTIYYRPKLHCKETEDKLEETRVQLNAEIEKQRNEVKQGVDGILEKWQVDNLESIPEVFFNQLPEINEVTTVIPFENIHAISVKPQKSPIRAVDLTKTFTVKSEKTRELVAIPLSSVIIKTEKLENPEQNLEKKEIGIMPIKIKEECDTIIAKTTPSSSVSTVDIDTNLITKDNLPINNGQENDITNNMHVDSNTLSDLSKGPIKNSIEINAECVTANTEVCNSVKGNNDKAVESITTNTEICNLVKNTNDKPRSIPATGNKENKDKKFKIKDSLVKSVCKKEIRQTSKAKIPSKKHHHSEKRQFMYSRRKRRSTSSSSDSSSTSSSCETSSNSSSSSSSSDDKKTVKKATSHRSRSYFVRK